jgi:hypothetical protein
MLGDTAGLKKAIEAAAPKKKKVEEAHNRLTQAEFDLKKVSNEKIWLLKLVQNGIADVDDPDFKKNWDKLLEREDLLNEDKQTQQDIITNYPSKVDIEQQSLLLKMGLQVKYVISSKRPWTYTIKGNLPGFTETGALGILPFSGETDEERERYENIRKKCLKQNFVYPGI